MWGKQGNMEGGGGWGGYGREGGTHKLLRAYPVSGLDLYQQL